MRPSRGRGYDILCWPSAAGLALAGGASAQTASSSAAADTIDEVVVVGTRASLQSAMNREAERHDLRLDRRRGHRQFPDKNIGEALGRVTGVQLARDFGEGNAVSIRVERT